VGDTKKTISSNESLQRLGIKPPIPPTYNLSFKLPGKTTVSSSTTTQSRPVKPHKTGSFEQLKLDLRVFLDEGDMVQVNLRGQSREFNGTTELTVKLSDFNRFNIDELLSKVGRKWPVLESEGWLQTPDKTSPFNGTDKLTSIGIIPDPDHTNSYSLVFPLSEEKHTSDHLAAKDRVGAKKPSSGNIHAGESQPNRGITEGFIGVNVRLFLDDPYYNIQLTGAAGDIRVESDFQIKKNEYENLSFGEMKKKIKTVA